MNYAYGFDEWTNEYIGFVPRQKSADGGYLMPGHATDIEPPEQKPGKAIIFNGNGWEYIDDPRQKRYWNKVTQIEYKTDNLYYVMGSDVTDQAPFKECTWSEEQEKWISVPVNFQVAIEKEYSALEQLRIMREMLNASTISKSQEFSDMMVRIKEIENG